MNRLQYRNALGQALLVTLLWSSSWVLIKIGLKEFPPLLFAGIRYGLAFLLLLPFLKKADLDQLQSMKGSQARDLFGLGLAMYFFTQGAQFLSLQHLPAVIPALLINLSPLLVALSSFFFLQEKLSKIQVMGVFICAAGTSLYFVPKFQQNLQLSWVLAIPVLGLFSNAAAALYGRSINRQGKLSALSVTAASMGIGSFFLLATGLIVETLPSIGLKGWAILGWLVIVNTSFAFVLWNRSLQVLTSVESSVINNLMLVQIAAFAWLGLGETLNLLECTALAIVTLGVALTAQRKNPHQQN